MIRNLPSRLKSSLEEGRIVWMCRGSSHTLSPTWYIRAVVGHSQFFQPK